MNTSILAIYPSHTATEEAIRELKKSGFNTRQLSVVGRDYETDDHVIGYYNTGSRAQVWGRTGAFWGGILGLLLGSAFFWIPGVGPLIVAGPLVSRIVGALEGAVVVGTLSAIGAALLSFGVPEEGVKKYETALKTSKFILIAHCSVEEVTHAREILNHTGPEALEHHSQKTA